MFLALPQNFGSSSSSSGDSDDGPEDMSVDNSTDESTERIAMNVLSMAASASEFWEGRRRKHFSIEILDK